MTKLTKESAGSYIQEMASELESKYSARDELIDKVERRRFMEQPPQIPSEYKLTAVEHRSNVIFSFCRIANHIMATGKPRVKVEPQEEGPDARKLSSLKEVWVEAAFATRLDPRERVASALRDSLVTTGTAISKCLLQQHQWAYLREEGEEIDAYNARTRDTRRQKFPFVWEHVPTKTYKPVYQGGKLIEVLEVSEREALPLYREYGLDWTKRLGERVESGSTSRSAKFCELWTRDQFVYRVDDEVVDVGDHTYDTPPYFESYAHFTSSLNPKYQCLPLVFPLLYLQDLMDAQTTIRLNWAWHTGFPILMLEPVNDEAAIAGAMEGFNYEIEIKQGKVLKPPPGFRFKVFEYGATGAELQSMHQFIKQEVEDSSLAPILKGIAPGSDISGTAALTMIAVAKSIIGPAMQSLAQQYDDVTGFMLERIEKDLKQPVPLWVTNKKKKQWLEIGPAEIAGYYQVSHELAPVIPAERAQMITQGNMLYNDGVIPMRMYREDYAGYPQPEKLQLERDIEELMKRPEIMGPMLEEVSRRIGMRKALQPANTGTPATPPAGPGGMGAVPAPTMAQITGGAPGAPAGPM